MGIIGGNHQKIAAGKLQYGVPENDGAFSAKDVNNLIKIVPVPEQRRVTGRFQNRNVIPVGNEIDLLQIIIHGFRAHGIFHGKGLVFPFLAESVEGEDAGCYLEVVLEKELVGVPFIQLDDGFLPVHIFHHFCAALLRKANLAFQVRGYSADTNLQRKDLKNLSIFTSPVCW